MVANPQGYCGKSAAAFVCASGSFELAVMDAEPATTGPAGLIARLRDKLTGGSSEASLTRRLAGTIFLIRVISAGLAYFSQVLLARWMGTSDYGVYVYVWTWVLLLGSMMDFGISASAQKIIPEYRSRGEHALLRGFLSGSRWLTFCASTLVSLGLAGIVKLLALDRSRRSAAALHRLHDAARFRRRQHPGRHRPFA